MFKYYIFLSADSNWDLDNLRKAIDNLMSEPPEGVINIDEQCTDYFFCPEYAMDIMRYLKVKSYSETDYFIALIHPIQWTICLTGRRRPARQTSEKDVLCFHRLAGP